MKFLDKSKIKQLGILFIIIGIFIPSILYPFTFLTTSAVTAQVAFAMKGVPYDTSLRDLEIVLVEGKWSVIPSGHYEGRVAMPYRYSVAFGTLIAFIGIGIAALCKNRKASA